MGELRWLPVKDGQHLERLDGSLVVYSEATDQVHCLDDEAAAIYEACQDATTGDIVAATGLPAATVTATLKVLSERGLTVASGSAPDRREFLKVAAAAGVAVGIWSLTAPMPAAAASGVAPTTAPQTTTTPHSAYW